MKNQCLIVDDNQFVRKATARLVEHCTGCPVLSCESAEEALRVFASAPDQFACVVTDLEMPGMNGLELGSRLRAMSPSVRVLLATGNPGALNGVDYRGRGVQCVLAKPFRLHALCMALGRTMPAS